MVTPVRPAVDEERIWEALACISDPEIPAISVVDLGVIGSVRVEGRTVRVELLPTFVGCLAVLPVAECPYCGSRNTTLDNAFGPTLCRAIYHCADCRQPFEQFKRV
jgi:ring-1,2-phenylacetyl-CoA epoxidase subunit PaaD